MNRHFRLGLLASSSVFAVMIGAGIPSSFAACTSISSATTISVAATLAGICVNNASFTGNISNLGTISPFGISLVGASIGGQISSTGAIAGGISLDGASTIASPAIGVDISAGAFSGGIINHGLIHGSTTGIRIGLSAFSGGIANTGTISAKLKNAIEINDVTHFGGGVSNSGLISSDRGVYVGGVETFAGGIVDSATGLIHADSNGVELHNVAGFSGGITNSGAIVAGGHGMKVGSTQSGAPAFVGSFGGNIANSGTISAALNGINVAGVNDFSGNVINSGSITSDYQNGIAIETISTFSGVVTNSGTISAGGNGIYLETVETLTGGVINTGLIIAQADESVGGIVVLGGLTFDGGVSNAGTISSGRSGIKIGYLSTFNGGITNSGTISAAGATGINVFSVGQFTAGISNGGVISAFANGVAVIYAGDFAGGISNSGTITAQNNGVSVSDGWTFTGGIVNSGSISAGGTGVKVSNISTFTGGVSNSGTISALNGAGIGIYGVADFAGGVSNIGAIYTSANVDGFGIALIDNSVVTGGISNGGAIHSERAAIYIGVAPFSVVSSVAMSFSGGVTNSGIIVSQSNGIYLHGFASAGGGITNSGSITAESRGIKLYNDPSEPGVFTGGITNSGVISASTGVYVSTQTTFTGGIHNSGTISARSSGIIAYKVTSFAGDIVNSGVIAAAEIGILVKNIGFFGGNVDNSATITAGKTGVVIENIGSFAGNVSNTGTISANRYGIYIDAGVSFAPGSAIINSGIISGATAAIDVSAATSPVVINQTAGLISGAILLSANADVVNVSGGAIAGDILGQGSSNTIHFALGAGTFTYGAAYGFSGANQVNIDSGTVILAGANSATATAINAGATLQLGNGGTTGSLSGALTDNGALIYNRSDNIVSANVISGIGTVTKQGGGELYLNGVNSYSGGTFLDGGAIGVTNGQALGAGALTMAPGTTLQILANGFTFSNQIIFASAGDPTIDVGGYNVTISGAISGLGNLTKTGTGTLVLTGVSTYTGLTTIAGGTLDVTGSIADSTVSVLPGATLTGGGLVGGFVVQMGGTLAPGGLNSGQTGTLTANGNLTFDSNSFYFVQVNGSMASQAIVGGSAALNGATVQVAAYAPTNHLLGFHAANLYTILTTGIALNPADKFNPNLTLVNDTVGAWSVTYDAKHAYLSAAAYTVLLDGGAAGATEPTVASEKSRTVAFEIDAAILAGVALPAAFQRLVADAATEVNAPAQDLAFVEGGHLAMALDQLGGQQQGAFALGGFKAGDMFLNLMLNTHIEGRGQYGGSGSDADKSGVSSAWGSAFGGGGVAASGNASTGAVRTTANIYGLAAGVDYHIQPGALVGLAFSGGGTSFGLGQGMGGGYSTMFQAGGFGVYNAGPAYVSGSLAYSMFGVTTNRTGALAGVGTQTGSFVANAFSNRIEMGYGLPVTGNVKLSPYAANQVQAMVLPSFAESSLTASALSLNYSARSFATDRTELGAWLDWSFPSLGGNLKMYARAAWAHNFASQQTSSASFQSLPGYNFVVNTARPAPNSALLTLGTEYSLGDGWSLGAKVDGEVSSTTNFYSASAILRKSW